MHAALRLHGRIVDIAAWSIGIERAVIGVIQCSAPSKARYEIGIGEKMFSVGNQIRFACAESRGSSSCVITAVEDARAAEGCSHEWCNSRELPPLRHIFDNMQVCEA